MLLPVSFIQYGKNRKDSREDDAGWRNNFQVHEFMKWQIDYTEEESGGQSLVC